MDFLKSRKFWIGAAGVVLAAVISLSSVVGDVAREICSMVPAAAAPAAPAAGSPASK